ncbi:MAG: HD domain-containing protein [Acidaminococcaceae bacterium]|nr:HD domain-containing protein [Acidaminococcaceae bacterium]
MEFAIDRAKVEKSFRDYTSAYNLNDAKVKLKVDHTFRVAALSDVITDNLGMTGYDKDLAWLLGMLHDIGRFEQVRRYHTLRDALSINHAELSADILFRDGLIKNFISVGECSSSDDYLLIEKVIRLHNVFQLPDDLTERELRFATILRDADKIDILRVNVKNPRSAIYGVQEDIFLQSEITDEVYEGILQCQNLNRSLMKTPADLMVGHISFVFGLVYPVSVKLMKDQGYLETVLQFPSLNKQTRQQFGEIRKVVHEYMEKRIRENS